MPLELVVPVDPRDPPCMPRLVWGVFDEVTVAIAVS